MSERRLREPRVSFVRTIGTEQRGSHGVPVVSTQPEGLIERIQSGDLDAFEEFFNTYKRPVFTTALAITRDPFLAEEILQDCFVKAYRVRQRLRRDVSPLPWLQRVTTNLCYSRISRRRAIAEPITQLITNLVTDLTSRPDQVAESREIIEVLQRGIDALPPKQQTAVILYYLHGYSLAEAAEIAECNVGTMKSRLHYALKTLRALLPAERRATALAPRMCPMSCRRHPPRAHRALPLRRARRALRAASRAPQRLRRLPRRGRHRAQRRPPSSACARRARRRPRPEPERVRGHPSASARAGPPSWGDGLWRWARALPAGAAIALMGFAILSGSSAVPNAPQPRITWPGFEERAPFDPVHSEGLWIEGYLLPSPPTSGLSAYVDRTQLPSRPPIGTVSQDITNSPCLPGAWAPRKRLRGPPAPRRLLHPVDRRHRPRGAAVASPSSPAGPPASLNFEILWDRGR